MADESPRSITTSAASWLGASLAWQVALMGILPIGFAASIWLHSLPAFYLSLIGGAVIAGSGGFWVRRHRYRFDFQNQSIDQHTLWFFCPTKTRRFRFGDIRSFDLIDTKHGPRLMMALIAGGRWTVQAGSRQKLEPLRRSLGRVIVLVVATTPTIETPVDVPVEAGVSDQLFDSGADEPLDAAMPGETESPASTEYVQEYLQPRRFGELSRMDCLIPETAPTPVQPSIPESFEIADPPAVAAEENFADEDAPSLLDPPHIGLPSFVSVAAELPAIETAVSAAEIFTAGAAIAGGIVSSEKTDSSPPTDLAVPAVEPAAVEPPAVEQPAIIAATPGEPAVIEPHIGLPSFVSVAAELPTIETADSAAEIVTVGAAIAGAINSSEKTDPSPPADLAVLVAKPVAIEPDSVEQPAIEPSIIAATPGEPAVLEPPIATTETSSAEIPPAITEVSVLETVGQEIPAQTPTAETPTAETAVAEAIANEPANAATDVAITTPAEPPATTVLPRSDLPSSSMQKLKVGVIGGSGLGKLLGGQAGQRHEIHTPFGAPSDAIVETEWAGVPVFLLARHGPGHLLNPSQVPYQANIFALKQLGCTHIIATGAVGSLREEMKPRDLAIADQVIDKTTKRPATFFDNTAVHVEFSEPFCPVLRQTLIEAGAAAVESAEAKFTTHDRGCYVAMEGPAFSTRAESLMHRLWGGDLIGMTAMPEAKLAREAEISYALVALVTDYDCWKQKPPTAPGQVAQKAVEPADPFVLLQEIIGNLDSASGNAMALIRKAIELIASRQEQLLAAPSRNALKLAIWSDRAKISEDEKTRLKVLWGRHFEEAAAQ